jgi:UDP-3-O-[3-hydroxymyristoyl] N-acetylglucosamine deacetylase
MDGSHFTPAVTADVSTLPPALPVWQHTLARSVSCTGVGVHSGAPARLTLEPAPANTGIVFVRSDKPAGENEITARYDLVSDTRLCSNLTNAHGHSIGTVEHVMAALAGCGVDNARVLVDGPEIPIMDGSSAAFVLLIQQAGLKEQAHKRKYIKLLREVRVEDAGGKWATLSPAELPSYGMEIEFASKAIGKQVREFTLLNDSFVTELGRARTFGFLHEVEQMRAMGLAKGGSLENAVVINGDAIMNEGGLRYEDEFVRHKLLDSVGDLALAGAPLLACFRSAKGGHALNNKLLRALFADAANWEWA